MAQPEGEVKGRMLLAAPQTLASSQNAPPFRVFETTSIWNDISIPKWPPTRRYLPLPADLPKHQATLHVVS